MAKKPTALEVFQKTAFLNFDAKSKFGLPQNFSATAANPGKSNGAAVKANYRGYGAEGVSMSVLARPKLSFTRG